MATTTGRTTQPVKALVALDDGVDRDAIDAALPIGSDVHVVALVDLAEALDVARNQQADLLVVGCRGHSEQALYVIDTASSERPDRPIVVLSDGGSPNGFVRRVFESGADDLVVLPEDPARVQFALHKAVARKQGLAVGTSLAEMVCVVGPKGGTGKTLTACNLGVALADDGRRAVVVDLDLQFGDVGLALGLSPERTIADLAQAGGTLDAEKVKAYLAVHPSGLHVLLAPTRPDHGSLVTVDFLRDLFAVLRTAFDFVIVDTPPSFTAEVIAAVDASTHVCMVGMLDALSLKNTKIGLETLRLMGYDEDRIALVLNRADTRVGIDRSDVEAIIGRTPDVFVPSDRDIPRAVNEAVPVVHARERSDAAKAFRDLARVYVEQAQPSAGPDGAAPPAKRALTLRRRKS